MTSSPDYFSPLGPVPVIASEEDAIGVARRYAQTIRPTAARRDRERLLPFAELRLLARSGLLGVTVPSRHGGLGISCRGLVEIFKAISAADSSIGQIPQNHFAFVRMLDAAGTDDQHAFFFDRLLKGDLFGNALSERGTGNVLQFNTRIARTSPSEYRVTGRKYYCTGALFARWIPIFAMDEEDHLVIAFAERHAPGLTVIDDWSGAGQRVTASGTVIVDDVAIPHAHVVPLWKAYERPSTLGAFAQILHVAIDVGIAQAALADGADFVRHHARPWAESGQPRAADEPHLLHKFGELAVALDAADALLERAARIFDETGDEAVSDRRATDISVAVAKAKVAATDAVLLIANSLFELAGTSSMDEKHNLDRHWRNARIHTLHDPVRWKRFHLGNWLLNGTPPPRIYS